MANINLFILRLIIRDIAKKNFQFQMKLLFINFYNRYSTFVPV